MWTFSQYLRSSPKGFTLIELLVVSLIIILISVFILLRQARFDSATLLRSLAYSIALSIRQAQIYGTSVRESAPGVVPSSYGVYFKSGAGNATQYFFAADNNKNGTIATDGTEDVSPPSPYVIRNGYSVGRFCAAAGTSMDCYSTCPATLPPGITLCIPRASMTLTVFFKRPNPDAVIQTEFGSYAAAYITVQAPGQDTRTITVTSTGQISVGGSGS